MFYLLRPIISTQRHHKCFYYKMLRGAPGKLRPIHYAAVSNNLQSRGNTIVERQRALDPMETIGVLG